MSHQLASKAESALAWKTVQFIGTKGIFICRALVVARLLSPAEFGLLAIGMATLEVLLYLSELGILPALIQRSDIKERYYHTAWTIGLIRALAIALFIIISAPVIADLFLEPEAVNVIRALAVRPVFDALVSIKVADLNRHLRFRSLAFIHLFSALLNAVASISLALSLGVWSLIAGALLGSMTSGILSYILAPYRPKLLLDSRVAKELIRFGKWILLISIMGVASGTSLKVIISRQIGSFELGIYYLAAQLAFIPVEISSEVFGSVSFPLYSRLQANLYQSAQAYKSILIGMVTLLLPMTLLLFVLAPSLVENLLGSRWEGTVSIIRILACVSVVSLFGETVVPLLKGIGQPYKVALLEIIQFVLIISLILFFVERFGLEGAALAWLPAIGVSQFVSVYFIRRILPYPFAGLAKPVIAIAITTCAGAMVSFGIIQWLPNVMGLFMASFIALLVMMVMLWYLEQRFHMGLSNNLAFIFPQGAVLLDLFNRKFKPEV